MSYSRCFIDLFAFTTGRLHIKIIMVTLDDNAMNEVELLREVDCRLRIYGQDRHGNLDDPLDELIFIILSDQTEEYAYVKTYKALRESSPTWEYVRREPVDSIAAAIKHGGLQNKKARYIKGALERIKADFGELSLDSLREMSDEEAILYLDSLPGVSAKNARCILMYSMNRKVFPVDTHVWRICRRLGLTPPVPKPTTAQQRDLEAIVPEEIRYSLHVNMVSHGREVCTTYWPKCEECVLADICPSCGKPDEVWGKWRKPRGVWARYADQKSEEAE